MQIRKVCSACGSDDVRADCYAGWNVELQEWELDNVFDKGAFCVHCDGDTRIDDMDVLTSPGHEV